MHSLREILQTVAFIVLTNTSRGFPKIYSQTRYIYIHTEKTYQSLKDISFLPLSQESYGMCVIECDQVQH